MMAPPRRPLYATTRQRADRRHHTSFLAPAGRGSSDNSATADNSRWRTAVGSLRTCRAAADVNSILYFTPLAHAAAHPG